MGGMRVNKMVKLLERLTDVPWRADQRLRSRIRLRDTTFPSDLVVAFIFSPWLRSAHAIVGRERLVYDGSLDGPISPQEHPRGNWYVGWLFIRALMDFDRQNR